MCSTDPIDCYLFDNGSLRAAATLSLRRLARALAAELAVPVHPVSLLHSSGVDAAQLDGAPAQLLEPALLEFGRQGGRRAVALPLFFGPSAALTAYVPERIEAVRRQFPNLTVRLADCLVKDADDSAPRVAETLAAAVRAKLPTPNAPRVAVVLTDHGSPQPAVTAVRNRLGGLLGQLLGDEVISVTVASMERREGEAYAFNDPLLVNELKRLGAAGAEGVIVAQQFLQAGRHAGPDGDIATICREVAADFPRLNYSITEPIGGEPAIRALLARRYAEAIKEWSSTR